VEVWAIIGFEYSGLIDAIVTEVHACCNGSQRKISIAFFVLQLRVKAGRESFTRV